MILSKTNRLIGAILLIAGTTIGAAMLALPISTGLAGFYPSVLVMVCLWLFMMLTAFYFLEVNLRMKGEANLITMMHRTMGRKGEVVSWIIYLLLLYSLLAAYLVGGGQLLADFFRPWTSSYISDGFWPFLIFLVFGGFVYLGTQVSDILNRCLMGGLVIAYIILLIVGIPHVKPSLLMHQDWSFLKASIAVMMTSFGYHIIIPTLTTYLEHDKKDLKKAIFIGSLIPLVVYILWEALVLGVIPLEGESSLTKAAENGLQATIYLKNIIGSAWVTAAARAFAFFAIVTSLLGVSLSLSDFLADGLKIKRTKKGKFTLILLTFLPPLCFAFFYQNGFLLALNYAGIFVVILLALLPSLMVWYERYGHQSKKDYVRSKYVVLGGKISIILSIIFSLFLLYVEVFHD